MAPSPLLCCTLFLLAISVPLPSGWAQDKPLPGKHPIPDLSQIQTILVQATVTHQGHPATSELITKTVRQRFNAIGYDTTITPSQPHDILVTVNCQEPPKDRGFDGPPCLFHYHTNDERNHEWYRIDRIVYSDGITALEQAQTKPLHPGPLPYSRQFLRCYDFPLLLAAEWAQIPRLLHILDQPETDPARQNKILFLCGEIQAEPAFPRLLAALAEPHLRISAIRALGNFGARAQPLW